MSLAIKQRFRGFMPVVIDVETAGFNDDKDALLEFAAIFLALDEQGHYTIADHLHYHIKPFPGANLEESALKFLGVDPYHPFRLAIEEKQLLELFCKKCKAVNKEASCTRSIIVGHNAHFDLGFLLAAAKRVKANKLPFHSFSVLDTASLSALVYGQTVLARALDAAEIAFNPKEAHSALYDARKTAELFCKIVNEFDNK